MKSFSKFWAFTILLTGSAPAAFAGSEIQYLYSGKQQWLTDEQGFPDSMTARKIDPKVDGELIEVKISMIYWGLWSFILTSTTPSGTIFNFTELNNKLELFNPNDGGILVEAERNRSISFPVAAFETFQTSARAGKHSIVSYDQSDADVMNLFVGTGSVDLPLALTTSSALVVKSGNGESTLSIRHGMRTVIRYGVIPPDGGQVP